MTTTSDSAIEHRTDCPGGTVSTFVGSRGDYLAGCTGCGRIAVLGIADEAPAHLPVIRGPLEARIPTRTATQRADWPTHKARRRNRAKRRNRERKAAA